MPWLKGMTIGCHSNSAAMGPSSLLGVTYSAAAAPARTSEAHHMTLTMPLCEDFGLLHVLVLLLVVTTVLLCMALLVRPGLIKAPLHAMLHRLIEERHERDEPKAEHDG